MIGCYVHIPFCAHKCAYCDFNSYSGYGRDAVARYVRAIRREIESAQAMGGAPVDTIFFGGGTPTAIPAADEAAILAGVRNALPVAPGAEITTEANPGSSDIAGLSTLREAGFNRISFGVQAFDDALLHALDRIHSADEARRAVAAARDAGFENVSLDLMYGLPHQTMEQWRDTLEQALELGTDHLSVYALIVEDGTGFATLYRKGKLRLPSDDITADMFEYARARLAEAGLAQYEISNYARPGFECRHNLHYWRNEPYYGFGAGAVSYLGGVRGTRHLAPGRYCAAIENMAAGGGDGLTHEAETPTEAQQRAETMMLGLRLTREGVDCAAFARRFGIDPRAAYAESVARLIGLGLLETSPDDNLRLTHRAVFLANDAMVEFV